VENKGEIDPDFSLKDYQPHLHNVFSNSKYSSKASIRKYDHAVSILSKMKCKRVHF
jgi:hypothetical protein